MAQIFLLFMTMTQESIWLISMLNSAITLYQCTYINPPPKKTKQTNKKKHTLKSSGWGKEIHLWSFEQNESDTKLDFAKDFFKNFLWGANNLSLKMKFGYCFIF